MQKLYLKLLALVSGLFFLLLPSSVYSQKDSILLKNGDLIVGEIKGLSNGVLTIETPYSKSDFTIEWSGVKKVHSQSKFLISLSDGSRVNGTISSTDSVNVQITDMEQKVSTVHIDNLVYLKGIKSKFWSRFRANVDLGISFTKANNLKQLSLRSGFGYVADRWQLDGYINLLNSSQDSINPTKRNEGGISYKYFLQKDWYLAASISLLSNTEQALNLRTTGKLGAGKYFVHTNRAYWGAGAGLSFNKESFTNSTPARNSLEGYFGTELNMFDIGDLSLFTNIYFYPSFTESGRWRSDFQFDAKYDLPLDFYIKAGITMNYDNQPAVAGKDLDYVTQFTIGWEL